MLRYARLKMTPGYHENATATAAHNIHKQVSCGAHLQEQPATEDWKSYYTADGGVTPLCTPLKAKVNTGTTQHIQLPCLAPQLNCHA